MTSVTSSPGSALIVGLGRTGFSSARWLRAQGWRIAVTDSREEPPELPALRELGSDIRMGLGAFDASLLEDSTLVVASPGVALSEPIFREARRRGLEIVGDIELFARVVDAPVVGTTGTNGKSTVTTLLGRMAERAGIRVRVGGNLGEPALDLLPKTQSADTAQLYVLELSSYQLESTRTLALEAATVLNVTADHLDRYASLDEYAAAKARIFARCRTAVVNCDDPLVAAMPQPGQRRLGFSVRADSDADYVVAEHRDAPEGTSHLWLMRRDGPLLPLSALKIAGMHNAANALAALALGEAMNLSMPSMLTELASFTGLPHRAEWVAEIGGVVYVDDSKGTNVGATLAAVQGMPGPLILIAGGDGKNQDFRPLARAFKRKVRHCVLIGRDAPALASALRGSCSLERAETLEEAVRKAARAAKSGDTVLLSPACASLDMFRDYTHRGAVFKQAVHSLQPSAFSLQPSERKE
jgi:UDP-N-acetylmuramoylalanine--D-glutamate ligase